MAFFSGQDINTLRAEGQDTNCFLSLIVDTKGTYQAAITRKVSTKLKVTTEDLGTSYTFFGEDNIKVQDEKGPVETKYTEDSYIEYFMLDVTREETNNPYDYLDARFEEIESQKKKSIINNQKPTVGLPSPKWSEEGALMENYNNDFDNDFSFKEWMHKSKESKEQPKQPTLFGEEVMNELIEADKWQPDLKIIHHLVCQLLTCSLIVNEGIDLKQWTVKHMQKVYDKIFGSCDSLEFTNWVEYYTEFIISHYSDPTIPEDQDWDLINGKIASAISDEIGEYTSNPYLETYFDCLTNYIYE